MDLSALLSLKVDYVVTTLTNKLTTVNRTSKLLLY